jgi:hypothetical protein
MGRIASLDFSSGLCDAKFSHAKKAAPANDNKGDEKEKPPGFGHLLLLSWTFHSVCDKD